MEGSGARRALEWFLERSPEEPSDDDLLELRRFLETLVDGDGGSEPLSLPEWEVRAAYARTSLATRVLN
jgi:hypothetical protein